MKIIFRADDLGFSEAVNYGIRKAIVDGVITCTGLMPNMPYAAAGYALVKDTGVEVGQHTNICVGRPLTDSARIPSLVQPSGEFCTSREIRARKQDTIVLEEVELEIQAQLDRFRAITGRDPAYFEGHAVMSPNFFQGLKNVAARNGLLYCDPVDPQWSVNTASSALLSIDSTSAASTMCASLFLRTRPGCAAKSVRCWFFIQGGWTSICWNILPIPSSARWRPIFCAARN